MKRRIRLSEGELRKAIGASVARVLREGSGKWPGDIDPRALRGFGKDAEDRNMEEWRRQIEDACDEMREKALGGSEYGVRQCAERVLRATRLIHGLRMDRIERNYGGLGESERHADGTEPGDGYASGLGKRDGMPMDTPVVLVGGEHEGEYTLGEVLDTLPVTGREEGSANPRLEMRTAGLPRIEGYVGPMWDEGRIRYESQDASDFFSA